MLYCNAVANYTPTSPLDILEVGPFSYVTIFHILFMTWPNKANMEADNDNA